MPERVAVNLHRGRVGWQRARPNDRDNYSLGETQAPISNREPTGGESQCYQRALTRFEPWSSAAFSVEGLLKRHRVSPEHLLLRDLRTLAKPSELSAGLRQQFGQADKGWTSSGLLLMYRLIPQEPAPIPFGQKRAHRLRSRTKPIRVAHDLDHLFDTIRRSATSTRISVNGVLNTNAVFEQPDSSSARPQTRSSSTTDWWRARWLHLRTRDQGSESGEGGGIAFLMLGAAVALLMVLGLVLDGSAKAHALDRANQLAYEAARAGLQTVNPSISGVDAVAVDTAVENYLAAHGVSGTAVIADQQVIVEVTITEPTKMLSMVGIDSMTVTGHGTANLVYGQ